MAKVHFKFNNLSDVRMRDLMQKVRRHGQAAVLGITVAGVVMAVPILLVILAGLVVGLTVYAVAALTLTGIDYISRLFGGTADGEEADVFHYSDDSDGRENVRVIRER